jgi:uncharacterized membrane protein YkgB
MTIIEKANKQFETVDQLVIKYMTKLGLPILRYSLALVFIWFGGLKVIGLSPAYDLVAATVYWLTPEIIVPLLGLWEVFIGIALLFKPLIRIGLLLLAGQMPGTFLPIVLLPEVVFTDFPIGLTMEGQYIFKNLVIIGAALVVGSTVNAKAKTKASEGDS